MKKFFSLACAATFSWNGMMEAINTAQHNAEEALKNCALLREGFDKLEADEATEATTFQSEVSHTDASIKDNEDCKNLHTDQNTYKDSDTNISPSSYNDILYNPKKTNFLRIKTLYDQYIQKNLASLEEKYKFFINISQLALTEPLVTNDKNFIEILNTAERNISEYTNLLMQILGYVQEHSTEIKQFQDQP